MNSLLYSQREKSSQVSQRIFKLENPSEVSGCFSFTFLFPLCSSLFLWRSTAMFSSLSSCFVELTYCNTEINPWRRHHSIQWPDGNLYDYYVHFSPKFDLKGIKILLGRDYIYLLGPLRYKCSTWSQCRRWLHPQN